MIDGYELWVTPLQSLYALLYYFTLLFTNMTDICIEYLLIFLPAADTDNVVRET